MDFNLKAIEFQVASEVRVNSDGKATFSIRATARLADVAEATLRQAFQSASISTSKLAKTLMAYGFEGASISEFGKTGIPDIAVAAILSYYAMDAGERCTEQSKAVFRSFAAIGIRAYAHKLTGYDQIETDYQTTLQQLLEGQVPEIATKYTPRYHKAFWEALEKCYGLHQGQRACGRFIKCYVYGYLPVEVQERLEEVNPLHDDGKKRDHKIHQHLDDVMLQLMLNRLVVITALLDASEDRKAFKKLVRRIPRIKFNRNNIKVLKGAN